jgi:hypothetical protein
MFNQKMIIALWSYFYHQFKKDLSAMTAIIREITQIKTG